MQNQTLNSISSLQQLQKNQPSTQTFQKSKYRYSSICMSGNLLKKPSQSSQQIISISQSKKLKPQKTNILKYLTYKQNKQNKTELEVKDYFNSNTIPQKIKNNSTYLNKILSINLLNRNKINLQKNSLLHKLYSHDRNKKQQNKHKDKDYLNQTRSLILDSYKNEHIRNSILLFQRPELQLSQTQSSKLINQKIINLLSDKPYDKKSPFKNQVINLKMNSKNGNRNNLTQISTKTKFNQVFNNLPINNTSTNFQLSTTTNLKNKKQTLFYKLYTQQHDSSDINESYFQNLYQKTKQSLKRNSKKRLTNIEALMYRNLLNKTKTKKKRSILTISNDGKVQKTLTQGTLKNDSSLSDKRLKLKNQDQIFSNRFNQLKQYTKNLKTCNNNNQQSRYTMNTNQIKFQILKNKKKYIPRTNIFSDRSQQIIEQNYKQMETLIKQKNIFKTKRIRNVGKKYDMSEREETDLRINFLSQKERQKQRSIFNEDMLKINTIRNSLSTQNHLRQASQSKKIHHLHFQKTNQNHEYSSEDNQFQQKNDKITQQKYKKSKYLNRYKQNFQTPTKQKDVSGWEYQKNPQIHQQEYQFIKI